MFHKGIGHKEHVYAYHIIISFSFGVTPAFQLVHEKGSQQNTKKLDKMLAWNSKFTM